MAEGEPRHRVRSVVRRGWPALLAGVVLSYLVLLVATLVAGNVARGLATLELRLFGDGPRVPTWVGLTAYLQGLILLTVAVGGAFAALLAASVEATRSECAGEHVHPWTPFRRGLARTP